jgi:hypothetical protein
MRSNTADEILSRAAWLQVSPSSGFQPSCQAPREIHAIPASVYGSVRIDIFRLAMPDGEFTAADNTHHIVAIRLLGTEDIDRMALCYSETAGATTR